MISKVFIFSTLVFGTTCTSTLAMKTSEIRDADGMTDIEFLEFLEKGFIVRKDYKDDTKGPCLCFSEEYYQQVLLPRQQKIATQFPNMDTTETWHRTTEKERNIHLFKLIFDHSNRDPLDKLSDFINLANSCNSYSKKISWDSRPQGRNMARKLEGSHTQHDGSKQNILDSLFEEEK